MHYLEVPPFHVSIRETDVATKWPRAAKMVAALDVHTQHARIISSAVADRVDDQFRLGRVVRAVAIDISAPIVRGHSNGPVQQEAVSDDADGRSVGSEIPELPVFAVIHVEMGGAVHHFA